MYQMLLEPALTHHELVPCYPHVPAGKLRHGAGGQCAQDLNTPALDWVSGSPAPKPPAPCTPWSLNIELEVQDHGIRTF